MGITSLDIINNLSTHRAKIINILVFNSEKLSIIKTNKNKIHVNMITIHFFWLLIISKVILKNMMIKIIK